jgi:hypothetical protein
MIYHYCNDKQIVSSAFSTCSPPILCRFVTCPLPVPRSTPAQPCALASCANQSLSQGTPLLSQGQPFARLGAAGRVLFFLQTPLVGGGGDFSTNPAIGGGQRCICVCARGEHSRMPSPRIRAKWPDRPHGAPHISLKASPARMTHRGCRAYIRLFFLGLTKVRSLAVRRRTTRAASEILVGWYFEHTRRVGRPTFLTLLLSYIHCSNNSILGARANLVPKLPRSTILAKFDTRRRFTVPPVARLQDSTRTSQPARPASRPPQ